LVGAVAWTTGFVLAGSTAWAVPVVSPTSGPSGTRIRVSDPACPSRETVAFIRFFGSRGPGGEIETGASPEGGQLVVDGPGTGVLTGPPGTYFLSAGCAGPFGLPTGIGTRLPFQMLGEGEPPAPQAAPTAPAEPADAATDASAAAPEPAVAPDAEGAAPGLSRGEARAVEVAARLAERSAEIAARQSERAARSVQRDADLAARNAARQAGIAQRQAERAADRALRAIERDAR